MENNFVPLSEADFKNDVSGIQQYIGKLKFMLSRKMLNIPIPSAVNSFDSADFIRFLNEYLRKIENETKAAQTALRTTECSTITSKVFEHNFFNDIIYNDYDYASILQFVDGLEDGILDGNFNSPGKIKDFSDHTITMAFHNMGIDVGGLVDLVTSPQVDGLKTDCTEIDVSTINSCKNSSNLCNTTDRIELYDATSVAIKHLVAMNVDDIGTPAPNMIVAFINTVCDYISFSVTMYLVRSYIIQQQVSFFTNTTFEESTVLGDHNESIGNTSCPNVLNMQSLEEIVIKDYKKLDLVIDHLKTFAEKYHIPIAILTKEKENIENRIKLDGDYKNKKYIEMKFYKELADTAIGDLLLTKCSPWICDGSIEYNMSDKYYHRLKDALYRNPQNQFESSRDIFLSIIKANNSSSVSNSDFIDTMIITLRFISYKINNFLDDASIGEQSKWCTHRRGTVDKGIRNRQAVMAAWLETFYEEVAFAFLQNLQVREVELLAKDQKMQRELDQMFNLDVPDMKCDWNKTQQQMLSVPSIEDPYYHKINLDFFGQPLQEAYMMYNEYVSSLPEFANDIYFKELDENVPQQDDGKVKQTVDRTTDSFANIITKLKSIITSLWNRVKNFWTGKSFQLAKNWVTKNEQNLLALTFDANAKLQILPYKENITLPNGFQNLPNNIKAFTKDKVASKDAFQKYLQSLYPNQDIANWFINDKNADQRYMNLILFDNGSEGEKQRVIISGDEIKNNMAHWIATIKNSDAVSNDFKKLNDDISNAVNTFNSMLVSMTRTQQQNTQQNNQSNTNGVDNDMLSYAATRVTAAVTRLWAPIAPAVIQAMMNEYNYIKTAYTLGNKPQMNGNNNTNNQSSNDAGSGEL